jgi:hypothetical protein
MFSTTGSKFYACSIHHLTTNFVLLRSRFMICYYLLLNFPNGQFRRWVKYQQMHHSFNVLVLNTLLHVSAFWNAETCRSILSTNTLNEWCICWSFIHRKKMHGPNCKIPEIFAHRKSIVIFSQTPSFPRSQLFRSSHNYWLKLYSFKLLLGVMFGSNVGQKAILFQDILKFYSELSR